MLIITLVAVCLGATLAAPGLGIGLIVLATPALIRSMVIGWQRKSVGQQLSTGEKTVAFAISLAVMFAIAVSGFIAFQIACWGSCAAAAAVAGEGGEAVGFGIIFGGVVAISLIGWLLWRTRPRRPLPR